MNTGLSSTGVIILLYTGLKLSIDKSKCILLGPSKNSCESIEKITVTNEEVKTLGIYIEHNKYKC